MENTGMGATINVEVTSKTNAKDKPVETKAPIVKTLWDTTVTDKDGNLKHHEVNENLVTTQGLTSLLDVMFMGGDQWANWYVVLTDGAGDSATASSTYAVPIYTEVTDITNATRPAYTGVQTTTSITNTASKAVFTINTGSVTSILGGALVGGTTDADVIGNTASSGAILYCAIDFASPVAVVASDIVSIAITINSYDYDV